MEKMKRWAIARATDAAIAMMRAVGDEHALSVAARLAIPPLLLRNRRAVKMAALLGAIANNSIPPDLDRLWVAVRPLQAIGAAAEFARSYDQELLRSLPEPIRVISWWDFIAEYRERPEFLELIERVIWEPVECRPGAVCWHSDFGEATILPGEK